MDLRNYSFQKQKLFFLVAAFLILTGSIKTYSRSQDWKNNLALFESGAAASPASSRTHSALAYEYAVQAEAIKDPYLKKEFYLKSIEQFKISLDIYPKNTDAWYNYAHTNDIMGNYDLAFSGYENAIKYNPKHEQAYNNSGAILLRRKEYDKAMQFFNKAIELSPSYADAYANKGACLHFQNKITEAVEQYYKALALNPDLQSVKNNLAQAEASLNQQKK